MSTIDNYEADYYYDNLIATNTLPVISPAALHNARIVNQSFVFSGQTSDIDEAYDTYAALHKVLFVSGIGNGPTIRQSRFALDLLQRDSGGMHRSVGHADGGPHHRRPLEARHHGPRRPHQLLDPLRVRFAAILMQAAARGDGGAGTQTNAGDIRTIKPCCSTAPPSRPAGLTPPLNRSI